MAFEFRLPDIGEGVAEGEVVKWFVKEGDTIQEDAPLVSVLTDKANVEIPSPKTGKVLKISAQVGEKVKVGGLLVTIETAGDSGSAAPSAAPPPAAPAPAPSAAPAPPAPAPPPPATAAAVASSTGRIPATPQARRRATELGIDLSQVKGTGPNGRITDSDVTAAAQKPKAPSEPGAPPAAAPAASAPEPAPSAPAATPSAAAPATPAPPPAPSEPAEGPAAPAPAPPPSAPATTPVGDAPSPRPAPSDDAVEIERIPIRGLRRVIAEHMATANQRAALFTYVEEVDATELVRLRDRIAKHVESDGVKLSYLPFILKGVVQGLRQYPWMNATMDDDKQEVVLHHRFHIGIATATPDGLLVPVIRDVDQKSLVTLAKEIQGLAERGRAGKLTRQELSGSTFTITSLGALGGVLATPIVNYPEIAILGVHRIVKRPVYAADGTIVPAHLMNLSVSLDHRILDGVTGAQFLAVVKGYLEDPHRLFAEMA